MDLNQLLYHHQIAIMNALDAQNSGRIVSNFNMVQYYTKRINAYRAGRGLSAGFVSWAAHSPDAVQASDQDFGPTLPASLRSALLANSMISSSGVDKAPTGSMPPATAPPDAGDTPQMMPNPQSEAQATNHISKNRPREDSGKAVVVVTSLLTKQLEEWENEGGAQFIRPRIPVLRPKNQLVSVTAQRNVHDMRAQALRDLINIRNIMEPSDDD